LIWPQGVKKFDAIFMAHRQQQTLDSLEKGEIDGVRITQKLPMDQMVAFALREGFLQ